MESGARDFLETAYWLLCAGKNPSIELEAIRRRYPNKKSCGAVWKGRHVAYRCKTCQVSDSSCMCIECFDPKDHEGHDYRMYQSSSGGCCDCGDPLAWNPNGFCKRHRAAANESRDTCVDLLPARLRHGAHLAVSMVISVLTRTVANARVETPDVDLKSTVTHTCLDWLDNASDVCPAFRRIVCNRMLKDRRGPFECGTSHSPRPFSQWTRRYTFSFAPSFRCRPALSPLSRYVLRCGIHGQVWCAVLETSV